MKLWIFEISETTSRGNREILSSENLGENSYPLSVITPKKLYAKITPYFVTFENYVFYHFVLFFNKILPIIPTKRAHPIR